jgi:hypothetical protein
VAFNNHYFYGSIYDFNSSVKYCSELVWILIITTFMEVFMILTSL